MVAFLDYTFSGLDILFFILIFSAFIQLLLYWGVFGRIAFSRKSKNEIEPDYPPVSVVIAARNEEANLQINLKSVLEQDYPNFEVVVVNNYSDDDSCFVLQEFVLKYPHLSHIEIKKELNFFSGKKFPLSIGIKSAKYDNLVFTDADCKPESNQWLKKMARNFSNGKDVVLGYGRYENRRGFLNKIVRFDALHVALLYLGFAKSGMPYMGVGRNMAYKKQLFYDAKGFISHYGISSGDDDLFVNKAANRKNCCVEIEKGSVTTSSAKRSFSAYCYQKQRHFSSSSSYNIWHSLLLSFLSATQWLVYILTIWLLYAQYNKWWIVLIPFAIRLFSQLFIVKKSMNKLGERNLLLISPFLEVLIMFLHPVLLLTARMNKKRKWK